jgi:hypothetical protein
MGRDGALGPNPVEGVDGMRMTSVVAIFAGPQTFT